MKYKLGECYILKIIDHAIGCGVIECTVVGFLKSQDKNSLTLAFWIPTSLDKELNEYNMETMSIIKSAIIESKKVKI